MAPVFPGLQHIDDTLRRGSPDHGECCTGWRPAGRPDEKGPAEAGPLQPLRSPQRRPATKLPSTGTFDGSWYVPVAVPA
jgi:hypothetical protein